MVLCSHLQYSNFHGAGDKKECGYNDVVFVWLVAS